MEISLTGIPQLWHAHLPTTAPAEGRTLSWCCCANSSSEWRMEGISDHCSSINPSANEIISTLPFPGLPTTTMFLSVVQLCKLLVRTIAVLLVHYRLQTHRFGGQSLARWWTLPVQKPLQKPPKRELWTVAGWTPNKPKVTGENGVIWRSRTNIFHAKIYLLD